MYNTSFVSNKTQIENWLIFSNSGIILLLSDTSMRKLTLLVLFVVFGLVMAAPSVAKAANLKTAVPSDSPSPVASASATPVATQAPTPVPDITQKTQETLGPLETLLKSQKLGPVWPYNPIKYAIRGSVASGVPANTIVLLLLLPIMTLKS